MSFHSGFHSTQGRSPSSPPWSLRSGDPGRAQRMAPPHSVGLPAGLVTLQCGSVPTPQAGPAVPSQTRVTMVAPARTASTWPSATACPASRGPSVRRTSTSVPATPATTGPTAPTVWTATPAPAPRASTASTARTTCPTARRGGARAGGSPHRLLQAGLSSCHGGTWLWAEAGDGLWRYMVSGNLAQQAGVCPGQGPSTLMDLSPCSFFVVLGIEDGPHSGSSDTATELHPHSQHHVLLRGSL